MQSAGFWNLNHETTVSTWVHSCHIFSKIHHHLHRYSSMRVNQYVHLQHIKVLKHLVEIPYWCGMQSVVVWSFNKWHHNVAWAQSHHIFPKIILTCTGSLEQCKCAPLCPSPAYQGQGAKTLCIQLIRISWPILYSDTYYPSAEEPVQGQSLVKPKESLILSWMQKIWGLVGKEVVICFQQNFTGNILRAIWVNWATKFLGA